MQASGCDRAAQFPMRLARFALRCRFAHREKVARVHGVEGLYPARDRCRRLSPIRMAAPPVGLVRVAGMGEATAGRLCYRPGGTRFGTEP